VAARNKGTHVVITANRTEDGASVYLRADGTWSEKVADAEIVVEETTQEARIAWARTQERYVCDAYAFSINVEAGLPVILTKREEIRKDGPTVPYRRPDQTDQTDQADQAPRAAKEA